MLPTNVCHFTVNFLFPMPKRSPQHAVLEDNYSIFLFHEQFEVEEVVRITKQ